MQLRAKSLFLAKLTLDVTASMVVPLLRDVTGGISAAISLHGFRLNNLISNDSEGN